MSSCIFLPKKLTDETLAMPATQGKRLLEPFNTAAQGTYISMLEDCAVNNKVELHRHEADLWICLEGTVEFEVGGEMIEPFIWANKNGVSDDREVRALPDGLQGDTQKYTLAAGDILFIPAGVPHVHRAEGTARLYFIKIPQPEVALVDVPGWK